jgi:hypothetical protein
MAREQIVPEFFHLENGEAGIFCGLAKCDWPHHNPEGKYCHRCNLQYEKANRRRVESLGLDPALISSQAMRKFNESLQKDPHADPRALLAVAAGFHFLG